MNCSSSDWSCVYHACMTDECQKKIVKDQGFNWGKGKCSKTKTMKANELKQGKETCKFTYEIKVGGDWKPVGRITYNMWEKENRRKKSTHHPEWIND